MTKDLAPLVQTWCDRTFQGRILIQDRANIKQRVLAAILRCDEEYVDLGTADALLIAIDRPEFLGLEVPVYDDEHTDYAISVDSG